MTHRAQFTAEEVEALHRWMNCIERALALTVDSRLTSYERAQEYLAGARDARRVIHEAALTWHLREGDEK